MAFVSISNSKKMTQLKRRLSGKIRYAQRRFQDFASGITLSKQCVPPRWPVRHVLRQEIRRTESFEAKHHNIYKGAACINGLVIAPGEVFSFWHLVGRPSQQRGFLPSRSLVEGQPVLDDGGGLCQLAGILYHLALCCNIEVIERHAHSRDLYTEAERFTPLGADAAVAFGHKDLRLRNRYPAPLQLLVEVGKEQLIASFCYALDWTPVVVSFIRLPDEHQRRIVQTYIQEDKEATPQQTATSVYWFN